MQNNVNIIPNRFSIKFLIGEPNFHNNPAITKNIVARAIIDQIMKAVNDIPVSPAVIVITLYGNGVSPAIKTAQ